MNKIIRKNILFFSSLDLTIQSFCREHIIELSKNNDVTVLVNQTQRKYFFKKNKIKESHIFIQRNIKIISDIKLFFLLVIFFLKNKKFDMIVTITPKAGIFGTLVGLIFNIKKRVHIFTGQVWSTKKGLFKFLLILFDKLIIIFSTDILFDSKNQIYFIKDFIKTKKKLSTVHYGSINGVDLKMFKKNDYKRKIMRKKYHIKLNKIVLLYAGRLNHDKGIENLVQTFKIIRKNNKNICLFLVGHDERNFFKTYRKEKDIKFINFSNNLVDYFSMSDIFCTFTKREGFGVSVIQASACNLPIFCNNIYGLRDSVKNNVTGIKFNLDNKKLILKKLNMLIENKEIRKKLGSNGRKFVSKYYDQEKVIKKYNSYFNNLLT